MPRAKRRKTYLSSSKNPKSKWNIAKAQALRQSRMFQPAVQTQQKKVSELEFQLPMANSSPVPPPQVHIDGKEVLKKPSREPPLDTQLWDGQKVLVIAKALRLLLDNAVWFVHGEEKRLRIVHVRTDPREVRELLLFAPGGMVIKFNAQALDNKHCLFKESRFNLSDTVATISQALLKLCSAIEKWEVCAGLDYQFRGMWKANYFMSDGYIDMYTDNYCYRSKKCQLLIKEGSICQYCDDLEKLLMSKS